MTGACNKHGDNPPYLLQLLLLGWKGEILLSTKIVNDTDTFSPVPNISDTDNGTGNSRYRYVTLSPVVPRCLKVG